MTYCADETRLLASAGRELAEKLLPEPFSLRFSNHDTGIQMTILGGGETVWRGSVWHSSRYEFNDEKHYPGIQPDFEFAKPVIDKYFLDVRSAVAERDAARESRAAENRANAEAQRRAAVELVRSKIGVV